MKITIEYIDEQLYTQIERLKIARLTPEEQATICSVIQTLLAVGDFLRG